MATKKKKREPLYEQVKNTLNRLQGKCVPSYQGLNAFWMDPEVFLTAELYGRRLIAPKDGEETNAESGCCGSSKPATPKEDSGEDCCGGSTSSSSSSESDYNPNAHAAESAVDETPSNTFIGDCWPSGGSSGGGSTESGKRSDNSYIVIGLKGLYPFDGNIFERLLWDADSVATSSDINLIAGWIDAGCPLTLEEEDAQEKPTHPISVKNEKIDLARGQKLHKKSAASSNETQEANKDLNIRKEISSLTEKELSTYREALQCMRQYDQYTRDDRSFDYWAHIHPNSCQHGWEQFVTWHRAYLYFFEQKLQDYDKSITVPYWSWTDYADLNKSSFNNTQPDLGVVPDAFQCFLTKQGLERLKNTKDSDGKSLFTKQNISDLTKVQKSNTMFNSGTRFLKAVNIPYEIVGVNGEAYWSDKVKAIYNVLQSANPLWFPNRWPGSIYSPNSASIYPTEADVNTILALDNWSDFGGGPASDHHFGALEKVHNGMHNFSGATNPNYPTSPPAAPNSWNTFYTKNGITANPQSMQNPQYGAMVNAKDTAFDPIFWSHHSNVDRIWAEWQKLHTGTPDEMNGALAPWSMTVNETMSIKKLGYKYLRDHAHYEVSNKHGLVNFRSEASGVSQNTLERHRKLQIKIHRIQRGNVPNAHIRVFLNEPEATVDTPTLNNKNFVEEIPLFHGTCFGGPGHCDLPLEKTRRFDHRPLHHHEPTNILVNATRVAQHLLNKGAKDLTVQLVVVGLHGGPIDNALFIDGVSMNFID